ncbi:MAG TPA: hypothetical protein PKZ64_18670 [Spirochaetota bacterium]|nr:hypothetical protein [Spirochaetota bacterium]
MKCPKCGYTSFDYSQPCPKCNKDISSERKKMNLPLYRHTPFFFLGTLLGESEKDGSVQETRLKGRIDIEEQSIDMLDTEADIKSGVEDEEAMGNVPEEINFLDFEENLEEKDLEETDDIEELEVTLDDFVFEDSDKGLGKDREEIEDVEIEPYLYSFGSDGTGDDEAEESSVNFEDISFDEEFDDIEGEEFDKAFAELELASSLEDEEDPGIASEVDQKDEDDSLKDLDSIDLDLDLDFEDLDDDFSKK